jgi:hypothetical protein
MGCAISSYGRGTLSPLKCRGTEAQRLARLVVWYMAFCLSYPFYTLGLSSYIMGLIGNAATFAFALYIVIKAWPHARAAGLVLKSGIAVDHLCHLLPFLEDAMITPLYAALLGLILIALSINVIKGRRKFGAGIGDAEKY